jgi:hypothetical protein
MMTHSSVENYCHSVTLLMKFTAVLRQMTTPPGALPDTRVVEGIFVTHLRSKRGESSVNHAGLMTKEIFLIFDGKV